MKTMIVLLAGVLLLSGCANIFDTNYLGSLDTPPAANETTLAETSAADLASTISASVQKGDSTLFTQLKANKKALEAVQKNLLDVINAPAVTDAEKSAKADAAKAFVAVTANSTATLAVANIAVPTLLEFAQPGSALPDTAELADQFFAGMSDAEVTSTLLSMLSISDALSALSGVTDNSTDFMSGTSSGDVTQVGVMSAAVTALMTCTGEDLTTVEGKAAAAEAIVAMLNAPDPNAYAAANFTDLQTELDKLTSALDPSQTPDPKYAYLADMGLASLLGQ